MSIKFPERLETIGDAMEFVELVSKHCTTPQVVTVMETDTKTFTGTVEELRKRISIGALTKTFSIIRTMQNTDHWLITSKKVSPCVEMMQILGAKIKSINTLKVGSRVRVINATNSGPYFSNGAEGVVESFIASEHVCVKFDKGWYKTLGNDMRSWCVMISRLEIIEEDI